MTEQTEQEPMVVPERVYDLDKLKAVKEHALSVLDSRRQDQLDELLHVDPTYAKENPERAARLKEKFLRDKKERTEQIRQSGREPNMGDMFDLAVEYFGLIAVVKLAETNHDESNESIRLKTEFEDLMHWLSKNGVQTSKLSRAESVRWFTVDIVGDENDGLDGYRAIIYRTRPLVLTEISVIGDNTLSEPAELMIVKEVVISIPAIVFHEIMSTPSFKAVHNREMESPPGSIPVSNEEDGDMWTERRKQILEEYMYGKLGGKDVQRINTAYLSALVPKDAEDPVLGNGEVEQ